LTELQTEYIDFFLKKAIRWRGSFLGWFYQQNYRGIQTGISVQWLDQFTVRMTDGIIDKRSLSVILSVKVNISSLCWLSPPLFLLFLLHLNSPLPNCKQPPPLKISPSSQHKSSFFYFYGHNIRVLIYCRFCHFL
jgi:hypothetical protein